MTAESYELATRQARNTKDSDRLLMQLAQHHPERSPGLARRPRPPRPPRRPPGADHNKAIALVYNIVRCFYSAPGQYLKRRSRSDTFGRARKVAMFLADEFCEAPLRYISAALGGRHYSTGIKARQSIEQQMKSDAGLVAEIEQLRRAIETAMRKSDVPIRTASRSRQLVE